MRQRKPASISRNLKFENSDLTVSFHELGCAVRTEFLLQYINDAELRSMIQSATNKTESFHSFVKWLAFGGDSVISTNNRDEQRKRVKYNHLVANCLIFHNVFEVSRILNDLLQEGQTIGPEAVAALSPYLIPIRSQTWKILNCRFTSYRNLSL